MHDPFRAGYKEFHRERILIRRITRTVLAKTRQRESALMKENESLKFYKKNMEMFFQVAADNLGVDPSCDPGKLDLMCTADAIRGLRQEKEKLRALCGELVEASMIALVDLGHRLRGAKGYEWDGYKRLHESLEKARKEIGE